MEIEKKYRLSGFPEGLPLLRRSLQEQGYLAVRPAVRIRRETDEKGVSYVLCIKGRNPGARRSGGFADPGEV